MRLLIILLFALILSIFSNSTFAQKVVKTDSVPKPMLIPLSLKLIR